MMVTSLERFRFLWESAEVLPQAKLQAVFRRSRKTASLIRSKVKQRRYRLGGTPAVRRFNAGRLLKRAGNGFLRQMAAMKSPEREIFNRTRLMVHRFFFNFRGKNASFH